MRRDLACSLSWKTKFEATKYLIGSPNLLRDTGFNPVRAFRITTAPAPVTGDKITDPDLVVNFFHFLSSKDGYTVRTAAGWPADERQPVQEWRLADVQYSAVIQKSG